ncbi:MAG: hypothetical protein HYY03_00720 [Chloroflexi bacterium]|nr:hypothetical protein [Chloroflexota bacterium]
MSQRRKTGRQRRRERRRERPAAGLAPPAGPATAPRRQARANVSWLGLAGALLGVPPLAAIGVGALVEPPEKGRWLAAVPLAMSAVYLPAAWASVWPTGRRQLIQRVVAAASIVVVLAGLPLFGPPIAALLLPATALLAIAGGVLLRR